MSACFLGLALSLLAAEEPSASPKAAEPVTAASKAADSDTAKIIEKLQTIHRQEAERWHMFLDEEHKSEAKLNSKPIYVWTNPTRSGGQHGAVYVWIDRGRPAVVGSIFSHPEAGARIVCHELHSLTAGTLRPQRGPEDQRWEPKASVELVPLR